jgi:2',3'-cyclic-nucleotide 2'-phosphodiesterase (5'-nucleotidase family)
MSTTTHHNVGRLLSQVRSLGHLNPLVLFSGDAFNPSLMSTITLGKQMVPILNMLNVKVGQALGYQAAA